MGSKRLGFVPVPYHRTLKAIAYSGKGVKTISEVLERLNLEMPPDSDNTLKRIHLSHVYAAQQISTKYQFTAQQCIDLEIDAFYQYLIAGGRRGVNAKADFVCKIMIDCRDLRLRQMIDTLLFIGDYDPVVIKEKIYTNAVIPSTRWGEEEIGFYRDFIWDASIMTNADWLKYRSWFVDGEPKLGHIQEFNASSTQGELLTAAQLSLGVEDSAMLAQSKDMLYGLLNKANRRGDAVEVTKLSEAINKNISLASRDLGDSTSRRKIQLAIDRIITPLDGSVTPIKMISREDLAEDSTVGDRSVTDQLDSVLEGKYDPVPTEESEKEELNVIQA